MDIRLHVPRLASNIVIQIRYQLRASLPSPSPYRTLSISSAVGSYSPSANSRGKEHGVTIRAA